MTRAGFVALIGEPNAGKSTLLNRMVGAKVSIVTHKVQTTRARIRGVAIEGESQLVFVDTPGLFKPRRRLDRAMVAAAWGGASDADIIVLLVEAHRGVSEGVTRILEGLAEIGKGRKVALAINKIDRPAADPQKVRTDLLQHEAQTPFAGAGNWSEQTVSDPKTSRPRRVRYNLSESPLAALARRKDRDGTPFLDDTLVHAGERLREDFELAQMGTRVTQNWDRFLTGGGRGGFSNDSHIGNGNTAARDRVTQALSDLGPGLSDVALRCCCYLEGLEMAEKRMGWSARSGKIVLRIALQRLKHHYENQSEPDRMIG